MQRKHLIKRKTAVCMTAVLLSSLFAGMAPETKQAQAVSRVQIKNVATAEKVIKQGKSFRLRVKTPRKCKVSWKSNRKQIVSVDGNGLVRGRKKGTAVISATTGSYGTAKIKVTVGTPVSKVRLLRKAYVTSVGGKTSLRPQVLPVAATNPKVKYTSSNPKVASVSNKGVISGKRKGTVTITVSSKDGSKKKAKATVKVIASESGVNLVDNFYNNINKDALATPSLDLDTECWSALNDVQKMVDSRCDQIVTEAESHADTNVDGSSEDNIAALSLTGKDQTTRDQNKAAQLQEYFNKIDSAGSVNELLQVEGQLKQQGMDGIIPLQVNVSVKDNKTYCLYFGYADNVLDGSIYESPYYQDLKAIYRNFIKHLLVTAGEDGAVAEQHAADIYRLQEATNYDLSDVLNNLTDDMTEQQQEEYLFSRMYLEYSLADLQNLFANCDILTYFKEAGYGDVSKIVVTLPEHVTQIASILTEENLGTLKAMAKYKILYQYAAFLDADTYQAYAQLKQALGTPVQSTVTEYLEDYVDSIMTWDISKLYVQKYISATQKEKITNMVDQVTNQYVAQIQDCDWMSEQTKSNAQKKLMTLTKNVLYPDDFTPYIVGSNLSTPQAGGTLVDNMKLIFAELAQADRTAVGTVLAGTDWISSPVVSNAWYYKYNNSITISSGLIGDVVYSENRTDAQNYGSLGSVIGHEISHAFDTEGANYNENGDEADWWTAQDRASFEKIQEKMIDYYNTFELVDGKRVFQNGAMTISENIADLAGVSCALRLVGEDYESRNAFFVSYGQLWAEKMSDTAAAYYAMNDNHASSKVRVNAVLPMLDEFYETYDVKKTDAMYVAPEYRITIW